MISLTMSNRSLSSVNVSPNIFVHMNFNMTRFIIDAPVCTLVCFVVDCSYDQCSGYDPVTDAVTKFVADILCNQFSTTYFRVSNQKKEVFPFKEV